MDYNIKFQPSSQLYYARIPNGTKYGRKVTATTKQGVLDKLNKQWIEPTKQNKDAMTIGNFIKGYLLHMEKRTLGKIDGEKRIRLQSYETYRLHYKNLWNFDDEQFDKGIGKRIHINSKKIIEIYKGENNEFSQSVALNAAAGLIVSGKESDFKKAFDKASKHLNSGEVFQHLTKIQSN